MAEQECSRIRSAFLPTTFFIAFSFLLVLSLCFLQSAGTKTSEFSQQRFQLTLWSNNCEVHAMLHCWELYSFMFDTLTVLGEWYYPPVMQRREENNAGTFETARKMNLLHSYEKHTSCLTLFSTQRRFLCISERASWCFWSHLGHRGEVTLALSYK